MSHMPLHQSPRRSSLPAGPNSSSGVPAVLRRFSTPANYTNGVVSAEQPTIDPTSLIDTQFHDLLSHPSSPPTVHQHTLRSHGRDYASVILKSHAPNAQDPPLLYFGEDITGCVILSRSDSSDMPRMDVVLQVFNSDPNIPWLEVKRALSSQQVDESQFSGRNFCWPFTITPPTESILSSSSSAGSSMGHQSSNGHTTGGDLKFELIVTIYRGRLTRNVGLKQKILYVPRPDPSRQSRSSTTQMSANLSGNVASTSTSAPSMASWPQQNLPTVIVRGVIFKRVNVEVECELVTPSEYPASDNIPLRLVLTSENNEALDLFSVSHVIDVRLQKVIAFGDRAGPVRPLTLRDRGSFHRAELAARANWVRDGDVKALPPDEHHRRTRWRVKLNGALQRIRDVELKPSYEEPGVTMAIMYFVSFFPFRATEFRPANNPKKELVIGKMKITKPP